MAFIPDGPNTKPGTRVRLRRDMRLGHGLFTAGHEFTIKGLSEGFRGWDLVDDEGHEIGEVGVVGGSMGYWFEEIPIPGPGPTP